MAVKTVSETPKAECEMTDLNPTEGKSPSNGTALWAAGSKALAALERAAPVLGILAYPRKDAA